jgi:hypothetical protein
VLYGVIVPASLHMTDFLETALPRFHWLTPAGFLIGLVESFRHGVYDGLVFSSIQSALARRWAGSAPGH